jgi:cytochrome c-type biogenesis protein CcmH
MKQITKHAIRFTFCILLLALFPSLAYAQDNGVTADQVNEVARGMFCPTCENTPLDVCPTQTCEDWRQLIRQQLAEGMTAEEIHLYFADAYGDHVLAEPPRRGFDLVIWILPIIGVLLGGAVAYRYLNGLRDVESAPMPATSTLPSDDYISKIEQELQNR